jgi:hypothetical protein
MALQSQSNPTECAQSIGADFTKLSQRWPRLDAAVSHENVSGIPAVARQLFDVSPSAGRAAAGICSAGNAMAMRKTIALAFAAALAAGTLSLIPPSAAQNGGMPIFIPPDHSREDLRNHHSRDDLHGEHYDTVVANYTRRCTSLDGQFRRLQAYMGDSAALREALALHAQGVAHCSGGARLQGIDELTAAIRAIGGIPRVEL